MLGSEIGSASSAQIDDDPTDPFHMKPSKGLQGHMITAFNHLPLLWQVTSQGNSRKLI